jgi:hypothetical protein
MLEGEWFGLINRLDTSDFIVSKGVSVSQTFFQVRVQLCFVKVQINRIGFNEIDIGIRYGFFTR